MAKNLFDKLAPHLLAALSDEHYAALDFFWHHGRLPRLRDPRTFNEKLLWLRIHYRDGHMQQCTDKYLVRDYVQKVIGDQVLVPMIGIYRSPEEIPPASLPESFILKATHGSGWNVVCRSKRSFDFDAAAVQLTRHLGRSYYRLGREWTYKDLVPRILCEELLLDDHGEVPTDYKFYCCHGEPAFVQVDYARFGAHTRNLYDPNWRRIPCRKDGFPNNLDTRDRPPAALQEMLDIARRLSAPFPFVRVDLYNPGRRVFFGELTFSPGRGVTPFQPEEYDYFYGQYLDLDSIREHVV